MKFHLLALYRNLVAGARLALFLPVRAFDYRVSPLDYSWLLAFNFAVWVAAAAIRTGLAGEFDSSAVPIYLASVPLVLVTAMVVAFVYGERERLLLIATALTASDSTFELVALALPPLAALAGYPRIGVLVLLAWLWLPPGRALPPCRRTRRPQLFKGPLAGTPVNPLGLLALPPPAP